MPNIREYTSPINSLTPRPEAAENLARAGRAKGKAAFAWGDAIASGARAIGSGVSAIQNEMEKTQNEAEADQKVIDAANRFANSTSYSSNNDLEWTELQNGYDDPNKVAEGNAAWLEQKYAELDQQLEDAKNESPEAYAAAIRFVAAEKARLAENGAKADAAAGARSVLEGADIGYGNLVDQVTKEPSTLPKKLEEWDGFLTDVLSNDNLDQDQKAAIRKNAVKQRQALIEAALGAEADKNPVGFLAIADTGGYAKFSAELGTSSYNNVETAVLEIIKDRARNNIRADEAARKSAAELEKKAIDGAHDKEIADILVSTTAKDGTQKVPPGAYERFNEVYKNGGMTSDEYRATINWLQSIEKGDEEAKTDDPETVKRLHEAVFSSDPNVKKPTQKELLQLAIEGKLTKKTMDMYSSALTADDTGVSQFIKEGRTAVGNAFNFDMPMAPSVMDRAQERAEQAYKLWLPGALQHYKDKGIPEEELLDPQSPNYIVNKFNPQLEQPLPKVKGGVIKGATARDISKQPYADVTPDGGAVSPPEKKPIDPNAVRLPPRASAEPAEAIFQPVAFRSFDTQPEAAEDVAEVPDFESFTAEQKFVSDQVSFILHELKTTETGAARKFANAQTVEQAVDAALAYERPSIPHRDRRIAEAHQILAGKGNEDEMFVFKQLQEEGMSEIAAAGMAGSLSVESGGAMDPMALGDNGNSFGIAQWNEGAGRKAQAIAFIKNKQASRGGAKPIESAPVAENVSYLKGKLASGKSESSVTRLDAGFQNSLTGFFKEAEAQGIDIHIRSGHRDVNEQKILWARALKKYGSVEKARKWVAPPGNSEHNYGTAVDLAYSKDPTERARQVKWAHKNAARFGMWFPLGNEDWHIEPKGSRGEVEA
jgi:hypothetical protein